MSIVAESLLRSKVVAALAWPHRVDRYVELVNPMWAASDVRARVIDVRRENPASEAAQVATITLQPTSTWRGHMAGQHVTVGLEVPGSKRLTRTFSISSAASGPGEQFTLTIRANPEGEVSKRLVNAEVGQLLHLGQAEGEFVLPGTPATPSPHPILMITGGSGITPAMSMLRTLLRDGYDGHAGRKVIFMHYARSPEDQIFAAELEEIAADDNGVAVHLFYGEQLFSQSTLQALVPNYAQMATYACGPQGLIELVQAAYADSDQLHVEFFKLPSHASGEAGGSILFADSELEVDNSGAPILIQAEAAGLTPESGCRMGICFSCVAHKAEGRVRNVLTGAESDLPDEEIRICVSAPLGNCTINL